MYSRIALSLTSVLAVGAFSNRAAAQWLYQTTVLSDTAAAGISGVTYYEIPYGASLGGGGVVTFDAGLAGTGVVTGNDTAAWIGNSVDMRLRIREGDESPAYDNPHFSDSLYSSFSGSPRIGEVNNDAANSWQVWNNTAPIFRTNFLDALDIYVQTNQSAPGVTGGILQTQAVLAHSNYNDCAVFATMWAGVGGVTTSTNDGLWILSGNTLTLLAREGSAAPGTSGYFGQPVIGDASVYEAGISPAAINDSGQIVFVSNLQTGSGGVTTSNNGGIWLASLSSTSLIARKGDAAPGTDGYFDQFFSQLGINNNGDVVFRATLTGGTVDSGTDRAIYYKPFGGSLQLIAREGSAAPVVSGATIGTLASLNESAHDTLAITDDGTIVFEAYLAIGGDVTTLNDTIVYGGAPSSWSKLWREGDAVPGHAGSYFTSRYSPLHINRRGRIAYISQFTNPEAEDPYGEPFEGVFATDGAGNLDTIASTDQPFDIPGGATDQAINFFFLTGGPGSSGGSDGHARFLSSDNYVMFLPVFLETGNPWGIFTARSYNACLADVDTIPGVDLGDYFNFMDAFDNEYPHADVNGDGSTDLGDFFDFFDAFDNGC